MLAASPIQIVLTSAFINWAKDDDAPLHILLPLNAYARAMRQKEINLQAYLHEYFAARAEGVASLAPLFREAIEEGKAVIMLDGLDEVQEDRPALVQKVEIFAHDAMQRGNRVLVTSRIVGYRDAPLSAKNWLLYTLLDFTPEAIEAFASKWCLAFERSTVGDTPEAVKAAEAQRTGLLGAIDANPGVARLASNPLLLFGVLSGEQPTPAGLSAIMGSPRLRVSG